MGHYWQILQLLNVKRHYEGSSQVLFVRLYVFVLCCFSFAVCNIRRTVISFLVFFSLMTVVRLYESLNKWPIFAIYTAKYQTNLRICFLCVIP